ncbi:MAG: hypothetical protein ACR2MC_11830 [Actinomycetota bacterium]
MEVLKGLRTGYPALLALAFLATGIIPAGANQITVHDSNDSSSAIDVARVVQGHYFANALYRVVAHERGTPPPWTTGTSSLLSIPTKTPPWNAALSSSTRAGAARNSDRGSRTATGAGSGELDSVVPAAARWRYGWPDGN